MFVRTAAVVSLLALSTLVGCAASGDSAAAQGDTGIGSEAGRLIGAEAADKTPYLGSQVGALLGRHAERGVATSANKQAD